MLYFIKCGHKITIDKIIKLSGLTARTLRHWEEIGLLTPFPRLRSNYKRFYRGGDVLVLQQILLMKRTGMSLKDIKAKITVVNKENIKLLLEQERNLKKEIETISRIVKTVSKTVQSLRGKPTGHLSDYDILSCFEKK